jgi:hypothetical protein
MGARQLRSGSSAAVKSASMKPQVMEGQTAENPPIPAERLGLHPGKTASGSIRLGSWAYTIEDRVHTGDSIPCCPIGKTTPR